MAVGALEARVKPVGITVAEVGRRSIRDNVIKFNARELSRWLLSEGLAEMQAGRLTPTRAGLEAAVGLAFVGRG